MAFNPLSDEQLAELEARFQRIYVHTAKTPERPRWASKDAPPPEPPFQVVFRKPQRKDYKTFRSQAANDGQRATAQENLAKATVIAVVVGAVQTVDDGRNRVEVVQAFDKLLDDWSGIPEAAAARIGALIGLGEDESEKE